MWSTCQSLPDTIAPWMQSDSIPVKMYWHQLLMVRFLSCVMTSSWVKSCTSEYFCAGKYLWKCQKTTESLLQKFIGTISYLLSITYYPLLTIRYLLSVTYYPLLTIRYLPSVTYHPLLTIRYLLSVTYYPLLSIRYLLSVTYYPFQVTV